MENKMEIFKNEEFGEIRSVKIKDDIYFVGNDIANILGYQNGSRDINRHVDEEDRLTRKFDWSGQKRSMTIINESGLYSLILSSKLPNAKKFKRWVTNEVLPSIRKHGMYATDELLDNPDFAIKILEQLKIEREQKNTLQIAYDEMKPKALFADAVETAHTSILIGDMAKILKQNGINIGQNRLFNWLRENGYLIKKGERRNMPTQQAMEKELFEVKERTISDPNGVTRITKTTKITGKGQIYFTNKFLEQ